MKRNIKINFIIPFTTKTGGIIVILEYYRVLIKAGIDVKIYYPLFPYWNHFNSKTLIKKCLRFLLESFKTILKYSKQIDWYFEQVPIIPVLFIRNIFIRDADITIATAWPTAYDVNKLPRNKGQKVYFIQGHEIWFKNKQLISDSYKLPLHLVTISPWLTTIMEEQYKRDVLIEVHNGIRTDKFFPPNDKKPDPITISMLYSSLECKGSREALVALKKVAIEFPETRIMMFGLERKPSVGFNIIYYQNPDYATLLNIYQSSHIFLFGSRGEGWGLTPIEAMACKCAVVGTKVGSLEVIYNKKNALIIRKNDPGSIYRGLMLLIKSNRKRIFFAENGYKTVQNMKWESAGDKLMVAMNSLINNKKK